MSSASTSTIRCEIDRAHSHLAARLLRSFIHHHCAVADCDVATVDVLEAAATEVIDAVTRERGTVTQIELFPDIRCVDIRLSIDAATDSGRLTSDPGPASRAAPLSTHIGGDGRLRLHHRFVGREGS